MVEQMTRLPEAKTEAVRDERVASEEGVIRWESIPVGKVLLTLMALAIAVATVITSIRLYQMSDPYMRDVLTLHGNAGRGEAIFQINCAGCHGMTADGNVGPSLHEVSRRKSRMALVHQVTDGATPPMPKFQPSPQEMADLLAYLRSV